MRRRWPLAFRAGLFLLAALASCRAGRSDPANPPPIEPPPPPSGQTGRLKPAPNAREIASVDIGSGGTAEVKAIVVRDKKVFWVEHAPIGSGEAVRPQRGSLRVSPLARDPQHANEVPEPGKRVASFHGAAGLAIDGKHAYLAIHDDDRPSIDGGIVPSGSVVRVALAGGPLQKLVALADAPHSPVIDGDVLWYHDAEGLARLPKAVPKPTQPTRVAKTKGVKIVVDETFVWVLEPDRVVKVAKSDGAVTPLGVAFVEEAGFAIDDAFVYGAMWSGDAGKSFTSIVKVPKAGGAAITLVRDQTYARDITVDATHVYWINGLWMRESELRRAGKDGRGAEVMVNHEVLTVIASTDGAMICASSEHAEGGERTGGGMLLRIVK